MASTTIGGIDTNIMVALVLLNDPEQVGITRCLVRAALEYRGLGGFADAAALITSELVTNAIQHGSPDPGDKIGVTLIHAWGGKAVAIVVSDSSPAAPVIRRIQPVSEHGRGLRIVEALSAHWHWNHEDGGKAVYAILGNEEDAPGGQAS